MENASKALIIAGAILIAILLISVGIMVMNSINKPLDQAGSQADEQAVRIFNAKFTAYEGKHKTAAEAKSLMMLVQSTKGVKISGTDAYGTDIPDCKTKIEELDNSKKYEITLWANGSSGKIYSVNIKEEH